jgi:hypothetical protein
MGPSNNNKIFPTPAPINRYLLSQRAERRGDAYLAEAQRLSHTGSFGWKPSTGEILWSEETF